jgi:hypothetical protein
LEKTKSEKKRILLVLLITIPVVFMGIIVAGLLIGRDETRSIPLTDWQVMGEGWGTSGGTFTTTDRGWIRVELGMSESLALGKFFPSEPIEFEPGDYLEIEFDDEHDPDENHFIGAVKVSFFDMPSYESYTLKPTLDWDGQHTFISMFSADMMTLTFKTTRLSRVVTIKSITIHYG